MSTVWALFSNKSANEIIMKKITPNEKDELIATPIGIENPGVKNSSKKAIFASFDALKGLNRINKNEKYGFSYEFRTNENIVQSSSSLAFAMKLVDKFENLSFSIAATGIVLDSSKNSKVEKINNINEKILACLDKLNSGDIMIFPDQNNNEINKSYSDMAKQKGIILKPVNSVEEAVKHVISMNNNGANPAKNKILKRVLLFIIAIILPVLWFCTQHSSFNDFITIIFDNRKNQPEVHIKKIQTTDEDEILDQNTNQNQIEKIQTTHEDEILDQNTNQNQITEPESMLNNVAIETSKKILSEKIPVIENSTVKEKEIYSDLSIKSDQKKTIRFTIDLNGEDIKAKSAIKNLLVKKFQKHGFCLNEKNYDFVLKANTIISGKQEIPLMPYASPSSILIRQQIIIENMKFVTDMGDEYYMGTFDKIAEYTKNIGDITDEIINNLFNDIDKNIKFNEIKKLFKKSNN